MVVKALQRCLQTFKRPIPSLRLVDDLPTLQISAAVLVYMERKIAALVQQRYGPYLVGPRGLMQPLADIVRSFVDYGGVIAAAITSMRKHGFDDAVAAGMSAAVRKVESLKG